MDIYNNFPEEAPPLPSSYINLEECFKLKYKYGFIVLCNINGMYLEYVNHIREHRYANHPGSFKCITEKDKHNNDKILDYAKDEGGNKMIVYPSWSDLVYQKACEAAVTQNWRALQFVKHDSFTEQHYELVCKMAIDQHSNAIEETIHFSNIHSMTIAKSLMIYTVEKNPKNIWSFIHNNTSVYTSLCTLDVIKIAIKKDYTIIQNFNNTQITDDVANAALQENPNAQIYINDQAQRARLGLPP